MCSLVVTLDTDVEDWCRSTDAATGRSDEDDFAVAVGHSDLSDLGACPTSLDKVWVSEVCMSDDFDRRDVYVEESTVVALDTGLGVSIGATYHRCVDDLDVLDWSIEVAIDDLDTVDESRHEWVALDWSPC